MDEVKDVIKDVLHSLFEKQKDLNFQKTQDTWEKIVGPKASRHTRIVYLTKDKIRVNVDSSAWLYDLNVKKERIRKELNKRLKIHDVGFRLGNVKQATGRTRIALRATGQSRSERSE